ncbi:DNA repair exonuclease [Fusibacter bizertensis]|uniref:DNA repair exonuclease n=1 Tax=Fusibacter bizertensis TaxID=1488331 RepID=A0ABT6NB16_9FIRM|nr:DNA repair exonuclease [Fusibacter bizertensis]MDH8677602.1 DNA repair exonuclease [Fusibacter bizertensis]
MVKLLHISDVHMNAGYSNKNERIRNRLKEAMKMSLMKAFDFALSAQVDGILIAGDFFDHDKISFEDESFVFDQLKRLLEKNVFIFYCSGNHDPMQTADFLKSLEKHPNFYLYEDDQVTCTECTSKDQTRFKILSVGHKSKNEQRNLIQTFPCKDDDSIWIGMAHASVPSALTTSDKTSYMATALSDIEKLNYNYFGLGHIHMRQLLAPKVGYSGNLQGLNVKEIGMKGGYLVTLDDFETKVEPVNFSEIIWEQIALQIPSDVINLPLLQEWLVDCVMPIISECPMPAKNIIVRIVLSGKTVLRNELRTSENIEYLVDYMENRTGLLQVEIKSSELTHPVNTDELIEENTVLSVALKTISDSEYDEDLLERLLSLPIYNKLNTRESQIRYLTQVIMGLSDELIERMVVEKNGD